MNAADFQALLPLMIISATAVVVMLAIAWRRSHVLTVILTLAGLGIAFASLKAAAEAAPRQVTTLLIVDFYALFYTGLIIAAAFASAVLSYGYFKKHEDPSEELYVLLLVATLGSAVLASSSHFASFFLGLEILSVALYAMISYLRTSKRPLEAGIKYLVLAASSAAFLLFGMALVYADLGTMEFSRMAALPGAGGDLALLLPGLTLILTGIGFKLGVVPFHMWTPDVYEGAPAPVTTYIATVSKGAVFALLLRYFYQSGAREFEAVSLVVAIIAIASMFAGNLLALLQDNVKRILAYSSVAHLGYLLVAFLAAGALGLGAATFYLVAYFVTTLGAFGVVTVLSDGERDADGLDDYRGLFWQRPVLGGVFTAMLLSLAGIPLTAGFLGKFYVVAAGASSAIWALIIVLVVTSSIGLFYYLRIIVAVFRRVSENEGKTRAYFMPLSVADSLVLAVLTILLIWFGVYPAPLLNLIQSAVACLA
jgi:NADH-quinone oxidoreductase subunit N